MSHLNMFVLIGVTMVYSSLESSLNYLFYLYGYRMALYGVSKLGCKPCGCCKSPCEAQLSERRAPSARWVKRAAGTWKTNS